MSFLIRLNIIDPKLGKLPSKHFFINYISTSSSHQPQTTFPASILNISIVWSIWSAHKKLVNDWLINTIYIEYSNGSITDRSITLPSTQMLQQLSIAGGDLARRRWRRQQGVSPEFLVCPWCSECPPACGPPLVPGPHLPSLFSQQHFLQQSSGQQQFLPFFVVL